MTNNIRTISPSTGNPIFDHPGTSPAEASVLAKNAKAAAKSYKSLPLADRKAVVQRALALVDERKDVLATELTMQMGRPCAAAVKEIDTMCLRAEYLLSIVDQNLADIPGQPEDGFWRVVAKRPCGVVFVSSAWNFPYLITVNALVPALLAGNAVILRPSPQTPLVGTRLVDIFNEAGLPPNVLQLAHVGSPDVLDDIVQIPEIDSVSFVGSTAGGIRLRRAAAKRIVPLNLELGGKDPAYVRADVDVNYAAEQVVDGAVFNSGQSCCSIERVYVHVDVYDAFLRAVQDELKAYTLGNPADPATTVGPVISHPAKQRIQAHIADAISHGAVDATPPNPSFAAPPAQGNYVAPTLLTNATHDMRIMQEETFGPVIPVMKVASDAEAVSLMNDSPYGLTASVWTENIPAATGLIEDIEAGTVFVNRCDYPSPDLAWTGWKDSGVGYTLGPHAFDAFVKLKSFHVKAKH